MSPTCGCGISAHVDSRPVCSSRPARFWLASFASSSRALHSGTGERSCSRACCCRCRNPGGLFLCTRLSVSRRPHLSPRRPTRHRLKVRRHRRPGRGSRGWPRSHWAAASSFVPCGSWSERGCLAASGARLTSSIQSLNQSLVRRTAWVWRPVCTSRHASPDRSHSGCAVRSSCFRQESPI